MSQKGQFTTAEALTMKDFKKLIEGLRRDGQYTWELFAFLGFCTALRMSDILNLKWEQLIDKDSIRPQEKKTKKYRNIKMNDNVRSTIKEIYCLLGQPDLKSYVVANPQTGRPYSKTHCNRVLKTFRVKYRLRVKNFSSHSFRKTFGRMVYDTHKDKTDALIKLNIALNHSTIETTKRYLGIRQEEVDGIFNRISI